MKLTRKFYLGSPSIALGVTTDPYVKATVQEAVKDAIRACEATGTDQIVVQIVRVIRRRQPPVTVEVVK